MTVKWRSWTVIQILLSKQKRLKKGNSLIQVRLNIQKILTVIMAYSLLTSQRLQPVLPAELERLITGVGGASLGATAEVSCR